MLKWFHFVFILFLFNFIFVFDIYSATLTSKSCSSSDVQTTIDLAQDGDIVLVPAGNCIWSSEVRIGNQTGWSPPAYEGKQITLKGAGIDKTIITDDVPKTGEHQTPLTVYTKDGKFVRITGFTFQGGNTNIGWQGTIFIHGTSKKWRVDHVRFYNLKTSGIRIDGNTYGVIDHCIFDLAGTQAILVYHPEWNGQSYGDGSWNDALSLGTEKAVYIENNVFTELSDVVNQTVDCSRGGRLVFRYNTVNNFNIVVHGTESGGRNRSCFSYEIYNNTFTRLISPNVWTVFFNRGGTGVLFNNVITGNYTSLSHVVTNRTFHNFSPWVACDGSSSYDSNTGIIYDSGIHNGTNSVRALTATGKNWTSNKWVSYSLHNTTTGESSVITSNTTDTITTADDPFGASIIFNNGDNFKILKANNCIDQVGRSTGDLLSGDPPNEGWPNQALEPFYEWNNTINGNDGDIVSDTPILKEGVDYFNDIVRPGYTPYQYPHPLSFSPENLRIVE